jgi:hypothetical protein
MAEMRRRFIYIFNSNKAVWLAPWTGLLPACRREALGSTSSTTEARTAEQVVPGLAPGLTPGLGATPARRLREHFGSVSAIFRAALTCFRAAEPSHTRPHHRRPVRRSAVGGSRRIQWNAHYGTMRARTEAGGLCGAGRVANQNSRGTEYADQAGREAGGELGKRVEGTSGECEAYADSRGWR